MVYLLEHRDCKNLYKRSAFVSAFFDVHAKDIYEFIVDVLDDDVINIVEIGEGFKEKTVYVEIDRFNEFVNWSFEKFEPKVKGGKIKEMIISDLITDYYEISKSFH